MGRDRASAREVARQRLAYYLTLPHQLAKLTRLGFTEADLAPPGSDRLVDALVACGTPDQVTEALRRQYDAGATQVALSLLGPLDDAKIDAYRALAEQQPLAEQQVLAEQQPLAESLAEREN